MKQEICKHRDLTYLVCYPEGFDPSVRYPVLLYLHGAGTRGTDPTNLFKHTVYLYAQSTPDFPFLMVMPLCHSETWFDLFEQLISLAKEIPTWAYADPERYYATGASMGGYGTWQLAISCPELFAAIVPVCGGGMYWDAGRLVNVPVWAFHGEDDKTVLARESVKMVDAVNEWHGNARLTLYPATGHDAWTPTYTNPEMYAWLLSHRKVDGKPLYNAYDDVEKFG